MSDPVTVVEILAAPFAVTEVIHVDQPANVAYVVEDQVEVIELDKVGPSGPPGPLGPAGPAGPSGPPGPPGTSAPIFEQYFAVPALEWRITHTLNTYPDVTLIDVNGELFGGTVATPDRSTVICTFNVPVAGLARLRA